MTLPSVSIVICNYNYAHFIADAIESALAQRLPVKEIIVVDDGSTDNSVEMVSRFGERIKLIAQANGGQLAAYNTGFQHVSGDIVLFLDSDDRLLSNATEKVAQAFQDAAVARVQYKLELIDAQGKPQGSVIPTLLAEGDLANAVRSGVLFLASPGSGNAYRSAVLKRLMPLPVTAEERHGADFFTGFGCALLGRVKALPEVLAQYRVHKANDAENLCFGNAKLGMTETQMLQSRYRRLKAWLAPILPQERLATKALADFSIQKQDFAMAVFASDSYLPGVRAGGRELPALARSIWIRDNKVVLKLALLGWAVFVWLAPRVLGKPVARYVCNPSSRRSSSVA
jgi:glycosyltransferase involved in cell wall biosynthesis